MTYSCGQTPQTPALSDLRHPNVLFVVWDTVRADRLGLYGYDEGTTPGIDAFFARQGRIYDRALSAAPWTLPAHAAMFTGQFPVSTGANHESRWLDDRFETLAERLSLVGYETYLLSANPNVSTETNVTQGFGFQSHPWLETGENGAGVGDDSSGRGNRSDRMARGAQRLNRSDEMTAQLLQWLDDRPAEQPFFAYLNLMDAHWPRRLSESEVESLSSKKRKAYRRVVRNQQAERMAYTFGCFEYPQRVISMMNTVYDANIRKLDRVTSQLLSEIESRGMLEDTLVIFTSDHGENLGDHHLLGHEFSVHESLLRVPLAIRYPERFPPGRSDRPVQTSDLYRSILDVTGVEAAPVAGETSFSLADGERRVPPDRLLVSEYLIPKRRVAEQLVREGCVGFEFEGLRAIERDGYKGIVGDLGTRMVFQSSSDPGELNDLAREDPERLVALLRELDDWLAGREGYAGESEAPEPTDEA
ncbi:MAG: sulfatase, partial [Thermoanaerobaculia bacterium]|nr:sulfatase [Thermoanaerobaculia bacterium]